MPLSREYGRTPNARDAGKTVSASESKEGKSKHASTVEWWKRFLFSLTPGSLRNRKKHLDKDIDEMSK